jgi:NitT/TauT family transport system permease protein
MKRTLLNLRLPLLVFVLGIALWEGIVRLFHVPDYLVPGPLAVWSVGVERWSDLLDSFLITAGEAIGGYALGIFVGIALGLFFALSHTVRRTFFPYVVVLQTIPIIAVSPLIVLWLGNGSSAVLFIAFMICVPPIIANTTQGLISIDPNLLNLFNLGNASVFTVLFKLRLPSALPNIFTGLRIAAGAAVVGAIVGETFAGTTAVGRGGLGYSATYALNQLATPYLFAIVAVSSALGFIFFFTVSFFEWLFLHQWHESILGEHAE